MVIFSYIFLLQTWKIPRLLKLVRDTNAFSKNFLIPCHPINLTFIPTSNCSTFFIRPHFVTSVQQTIYQLIYIALEKVHPASLSAKIIFKPFKGLVIHRFFRALLIFIWKPHLPTPLRHLSHRAESFPHRSRSLS